MITEEKKLKHQKILAQINYFIHGSKRFIREEFIDDYCRVVEFVGRRG